MSDVPAGGETNFPRAHGGPDLPNHPEACGERGVSVKPERGKVFGLSTLSPHTAHLLSTGGIILLAEARRQRGHPLSSCLVPSEGGRKVGREQVGAFNAEGLRSLSQL